MFAAAAAALRDQGLFAFTVFPHEQADQVAVHADIGLAYGGCYMHGRDYIARTAALTGFAVELLDAQVQENYRGRPRMCLLGVLRRDTRKA